MIALQMFAGIGGVILITVFVGLLLDWGIHIYGTTNSGDRIAWENFNDFLRMYSANAANFEKLPSGALGIWDGKEFSSYISQTGIIEFNYIIMKLDFISYTRYSSWWAHRLRTEKVAVAPIENPWGGK
jgi:hypothetical protein